MGRRRNRRKIERKPRMAFHGSDYHGVAKQVLGEGPYAVEYAVLTGNGYFRKVEITRRDGKHIGTKTWACLHRIRRFKTIQGATTFFLKKKMDMTCPMIYLWKHRKVRHYSTPDESGRYLGGLRYYSSDELWRFSHKTNDQFTHKELWNDIHRVVGTPRRGGQ